MRNLVDIWTRVNEASERVEVIKQRAGVVHHKIDCTDYLFIGSDVAIAIEHEMRKQVGKIISLSPTAAMARAERGYTVNQSHLRQIEENACNATVGFREHIKRVVVLKIKRCLRSGQSDFAMKILVRQRKPESS